MYSFSSVFVKTLHANQTKGSKDNWGQTRHRQTTDRQTDRQTDIFELTPIHKRKFNFFSFAHESESMNGVKFIPPCSARRGIKEQFLLSRQRRTNIQKLIICQNHFVQNSIETDTFNDKSPTIILEQSARLIAKQDDGTQKY